MKPLAPLDVPEGFSLVGNGGVYWLESHLAKGVVRFTLARDQEGRDFDLGLSQSSQSEESERASVNRRVIVEAIGLDPGSVRIVDQVHGGAIQQLFPDDVQGGFVPAAAPPREADGMVAIDDQIVMAVSVADCAAVAVSGERGRALLHCGWRGLTTDMVERAVEIVDGCDAVIGPCIGACCFEVGPDVAERLGVDRTGRGTVDIGAIAAAQLQAAGVKEIRAADLCTHCNPEHFFSFRRQSDSAGRQMAIFSRS